MPEFLERRFNASVPCTWQRFDIGLHLHKISVQLYAASVVLGGSRVGLCGSLGVPRHRHRNLTMRGTRCLIYTDTVQTLILITGAVALTLIGLHRVGGLEHLRTMVPAD